jgi:hypothetical protein
MKEYRVSKSREEIIKLVQKKFEAETLMTIWQKDPKTGTRLFKCDVKFSSIDPHEGIFSIDISEGDKKLFQPALETYFLLQVQDFVFKTKTSVSRNHQKESLVFQIPHDVRLQEKRLKSRVYLGAEEKRFVSATFSTKASGLIDVACPIYNISHGGICIIVSKETLSNVKLNEEIALVGLSFFESLPNEMKATVKNARVHTKKDFSSDEFYALGLEFKN